MDIAAIVKGLGGPAHVGRMLGIPPNNVTQWSVRGRIPIRYWADLVRAPGARKLGLTMSALAAHVQKESA